MTQLSLEFKKEFKVKITLRLLLEDATSPDLLAAYLDSQLPPDAYAPAAGSLLPYRARQPGQGRVAPMPMAWHSSPLSPRGRRRSH